jgi:hypothetical protein
MFHDHEEASPPRIDISACLDAVSLYDAAYHRDRGNPVAQPVEPPNIVSLWEYLWARGKRTGVELLVAGLFLTTLAAGVGVVANGIHNGYEFLRSLPKGECVTPPGTPDRMKDADDPNTCTEVIYLLSPDPLPPEWVETNLGCYASLLLVIYLSHVGSVHFLRKAKKIKTGVPIQYANTVHLPAQESLVRASQEPTQETLIRAASEPAQETLVRAASPPSTSPSVLLRSVGQGQERHEEQLVRASAESPQD